MATDRLALKFGGPAPSAQLLIKHVAFCSWSGALAWPLDAYRERWSYFLGYSIQQTPNIPLNSPSQPPNITESVTFHFSGEQQQQMRASKGALHTVENIWIIGFMNSKQGKPSVSLVMPIPSAKYSGGANSWLKLAGVRLFHVPSHKMAGCNNWWLDTLGWFGFLVQMHVKPGAFFIQLCFVVKHSESLV